MDINKEFEEALAEPADMLAAGMAKADAESEKTDSTKAVVIDTDNDEVIVIDADENQKSSTPSGKYTVVNVTESNDAAGQMQFDLGKISAYSEMIGRLNSMLIGKTYEEVIRDIKFAIKDVKEYRNALLDKKYQNETVSFGSLQKKLITEEVKTVKPETYDGGDFWASPDGQIYLHGRTEDHVESAERILSLVYPNKKREIARFTDITNAPATLFELGWVRGGDSTYKHIYVYLQGNGKLGEKTMKTLAARLPFDHMIADLMIGNERKSWEGSTKSFSQGGFEAKQQEKNRFDEEAPVNNMGSGNIQGAPFLFKKTPFRRKSKLVELDPVEYKKTYENRKKKPITESLANTIIRNKETKEMFYIHGAE